MTRRRLTSFRQRLSSPTRTRISNNELKIVASELASWIASPTVLTLCPTSRPASKRSCKSRRAASANASPGPVVPAVDEGLSETSVISCNNIRSTSDPGVISPRAYPPCATTVTRLLTSIRSFSGSSSRIAAQIARTD